MAIWKRPISLADLNATSKNTLIEHLNIIYTDVTENTLSATMPVCSFTHQPLGMLHGGASVVLAETLGSLAANFCVDDSRYCVGLDINANHIRAMREGMVIGTASPVHLGISTQVWQIEITDEKERLVCTSRLTMAVKQAKYPRSTCHES
ncbi:hotdog fold thioesterase [Vibrio sp. V27_P1S3P104]|uniref:hotdog fold thioesterase n=1 Tax=unclassified Vibrio TaxID=2614977 RepID=UPI0013735B85|nr:MULTISPECIES: hotdog fold thioesterase [unclassified Vibrio]NAW70187.1 hotdog fold thioesterase [Vibrio sp. V28_P6S34P95]NAX05562.1 hotdog fold thioesterase [Vibrio sp. V30_P3S12P165]NAX33779.1 hotdog fold thioesterase [Vibrio sp. V29_P1S30P107]NAX38539.1 hotdog fold thioesterase [Vibrio sp. V27_P1S3P104]NAX40407.1 hotdog fold thioesterase [Vibrio sp. V26_P1S5P106]